MKTQITKIRNKSGDVTTDLIKNHSREYSEQLFTNKFDNLDTLKNSWKHTNHQN